MDSGVLVCVRLMDVMKSACAMEKEGVRPSICSNLIMSAECHYKNGVVDAAIGKLSVRKSGRGLEEHV